MLDKTLQLNVLESAKDNVFQTTSFGSDNAINPFVKSKSDSFEKTQTKPINSKKTFNFDFLKKKYVEFLHKKFFYSYADEEEIQNMIKANPAIKVTLKANNIPLKICVDNLENTYKTHIANTTEIAKKIATCFALSPSDMAIVEKGALLHDFGKVLMPKELIEKPEKLTKAEEKIMSKHAILGYELLKTTGIEPEIASIVKNHHTYNYNLPNTHSSLLSQIVTVADIYSALTTKRAYKNALSQTEALQILDNLAQENKVNKDVVTALKTQLV